MGIWIKEHPKFDIFELNRASVNRLRNVLFVYVVNVTNTRGLFIQIL